MKIKLSIGRGLPTPSTPLVITRYRLCTQWFSEVYDGNVKSLINTVVMRKIKDDKKFFYHCFLSTS